MTTKISQVMINHTDSIKVGVDHDGLIYIEQINDGSENSYIYLDECCVDKFIKLLLKAKKDYQDNLGDNNE